MLGDQKGFSLLEILIAITLLAIVSTLVGTSVMKSFHEGRVKSARIQSSNFESGLDDFARDNGRYPTTAEGLESLIENPGSLKNYREGGYMKRKRLPLDPWGHEYIYTNEGGDNYTIASYGAAGEEGGEKNNKDIIND